MDKLFAFLDPKQSKGYENNSLNSTLTAYFSKALEVLMKYHPKEIIKYVVHTDYQVFDKMLDHIENKSICELFIQILNLIAN